MRALILGAAGFVGQYLYRHIADDLGWDVTVTKLENERLGFDADTRDLDILEKDAVLALVKDVMPDVIFHLAAQSSVALSWKRPDLTVDVNVKGSLNVLEALREYAQGVRIVLIGSGEEYGFVREDEVPVNEENPLRPGNLYALTKAAQTMAGQIYARAYGLDIVMVRAFNHIGPGQAPIFVVSDFCRQIAQMEAGRREATLRVGNLGAKRDFTDVRDVVRAYGLLAQKGVSGTIYNVGSGQAYGIDEVLAIALKKSLVPICVEVDPDRLRPSDVPILLADISKLRRDTGWEPEIPLDRSIDDTLAHWRRQIGLES